MGSGESFQSHCTIHNKFMLIVIDLTINSCGEFEFTVKTMNALLTKRFTDLQRVDTKLPTVQSNCHQYVQSGLYPIDSLHIMHIMKLISHSCPGHYIG